MMEGWDVELCDSRNRGNRLAGVGVSREIDVCGDRQDCEDVPEPVCNGFGPLNPERTPNDLPVEVSNAEHPPLQYR